MSPRALSARYIVVPAASNAGPFGIVRPVTAALTVPSGAMRYNVPAPAVPAYAIDPAQNRPDASATPSFIRIGSAAPSSGRAVQVGRPRESRIAIPVPAAAIHPPPALGATAPSGASRTASSWGSSPPPAD